MPCVDNRLHDQGISRGSHGRVPRSPLAQLRVWHLALLVLFVAIAIADIQDHHREERSLIVLASVGYGLYALIGWVAWRQIQRFKNRVGRTRLLILYMIGMAAFFLLATVIYLWIENAYLAGRFRAWNPILIDVNELVGVDQSQAEMGQRRISHEEVSCQIGLGSVGISPVGESKGRRGSGLPRPVRSRRRSDARGHRRLRGRSGCSGA